MRRWFFYFFAATLFICCSKHEQNKIIPRKDLIPLLVDLHISDAMATNYNINEAFGGLDSAILYSTVLKSYGYTKDDFIKTIEYYTKEPEKLIKIYDEVFSILSNRSEDAKKMYDSYSVKNTKSIWKSKQTHYRIIGDTAHYPSMFEVAVDTVGIFVLHVEIRVTEKDKSINPRIVAYFYNLKNDVPEKRVYFEEVKLLKSSYKREYTLTQECSNPDLNRLRLLIPTYDNTTNDFYKDMEISNLRVSLVVPQESK